MERASELLLVLWREACRHIQIGESTADIAAHLAAHAPVGHIIVRRLDRPHAALVTVAVGPSHPDPQILGGRTAVSPPQVARLTAWAKRPRVWHRAPNRAAGHDLAFIIPPGLDGDVVAGPLTGPEGAAGVLLLIARAGQHFLDRHTQLFESLLELFSVALENDRRLHEMAALREAAEADRQSLLTRLGRKELADAVVGADTGLRPVMERVELVSRSDVPVLILGETGTGKELVARAIHNRSDRHAGPFIRVNCGAIPPELIDSQLFGHEKGSFTGATDTRRGWFERADGGTLFLDEIGELPLAAQVRLLRVLQDGYIERVGAEQPTRVDVRIVAATHRDLTAMVRDTRFREDLWYRIAVFPILLPPLRERVEDIPALARHFVERAATRFGLPPVEPSSQDIALLAAYPWPGNVRELGAVIDRAAILGNGQSLEVAKSLGIAAPTAAPAAIVQPLIETQSPVPAPVAPISSSSPDAPIAALDVAMRRHIEQTLTKTLGRVDGPFGAARLLNINPHTLRSRMRKLGIQWSQYRQRGL